MRLPRVPEQLADLLGQRRLARARSARDDQARNTHRCCCHPPEPAPSADSGRRGRVTSKQAPGARRSASVTSRRGGGDADDGTVRRDRRLVRGRLPVRPAGKPSPHGFADRIGVDRAVADMLGPRQRDLSRGRLRHWHLRRRGCGRSAGTRSVWTCPTGMLRHARGGCRSPDADATVLPVTTGTVDAVITVMVHTDLPAYAPVLAEIHRVLKPGGVRARRRAPLLLRRLRGPIRPGRRRRAARATSMVPGPPSHGPTEASATRSAPGTSPWPR